MQFAALCDIQDQYSVVCLPPASKWILLNLIKEGQSLLKKITGPKVKKFVSSLDIEEAVPSFHPLFLSSSHTLTISPCNFSSSEKYTSSSFLPLFILMYFAECRIFLSSDLPGYNCCSVCTGIQQLVTPCLWQKLNPWPLLYTVSEKKH